LICASLLAGHCEFIAKKNTKWIGLLLKIDNPHPSTTCTVANLVFLALWNQSIHQNIHHSFVPIESQVISVHACHQSFHLTQTGDNTVLSLLQCGANTNPALCPKNPRFWFPKFWQVPRKLRAIGGGGGTDGGSAIRMRACVQIAPESEFQRIRLIVGQAVVVSFRPRKYGTIRNDSERITNRAAIWRHASPIHVVVSKNKRSFQQSAFPEVGTNGLNPRKPERFGREPGLRVDTLVIAVRFVCDFFGLFCLAAENNDTLLTEELRTAQLAETGKPGNKLRPLFS
jgi:hypothetical protein